MRSAKKQAGPSKLRPYDVACQGRIDDAMATYAIGDIQGCTATLMQLLQRLNYRPAHDHLIVVGDLVNRGPQSLQALRWAHAQQDHVTLVLGNHDLALLAHASGVRPLRPKDTFDDIMAAPDKDMLLEWLASRPLAHAQKQLLAVHAGALPSWRAVDVLAHAQRAQRALTGPQSAAFLAALETQAAVPAELADAVAAARVLTYLRVLDAQGVPDYSIKGPAKDLPAGSMPWFAAPMRATADTKMVCGHWAALGLHVQHNIRALDTGCVWGGPLTAWCAETDAIIQVPYAEAQPPLSTQSD